MIASEASAILREYYDNLLPNLYLKIKKAAESGWPTTTLRKDTPYEVLSQLAADGYKVEIGESNIIVSWQ